MKITQIAAALGAAVLLGAAAAPAQQAEEGPGKKKAAAPVRAIRLTGAGQQRTPPTQEELKQRFAKKLESEWLKNAGWITDFDAVRAQSAATGKQIFAYFTRSYAP